MLYGDSLRVVGRAKDAAFALATALRLAPERTQEIGSRMGVLYEERGKRRVAEWWFRRATEPDCKEDFLWVMRGANLAKLEQFERALSCYELAIKLDGPNLSEAYLNLGLVHRALRNYADAAAAFASALAIAPDDDDVSAAIRSLDGMDELAVVDRILAAEGADKRDADGADKRRGR